MKVQIVFFFRLGLALCPVFGALKVTSIFPVIPCVPCGQKVEPARDGMQPTLVVSDLPVATRRAQRKKNPFS